MSESFGPDTNKTKAAATADAVNYCLYSLIYRSQRKEGVKNHFDVSVITYGSEEGKAEPMWQDKPLKLSELPAKSVDTRTYPKGVDAFGKVQERDLTIPIWVNPIAVGDTPMEKAFSIAESLLREWIPQHTGGDHKSVAPIVINITDGEWNPGEDPQSKTDSIKKLQTSCCSKQHNTLVWNCHITSENVPRIVFPASNSFPGLSGKSLEVAKSMFAMSSEIPDYMIPVAKERVTANLDLGARGFVYNGDMNALDNLAKLVVAGTPIGK